MDCETFDQHLMDAVYDELDGDLAAAFKLHLESCVSCAQTFTNLKRTREEASSALPREEPSLGLEERILAAEKIAHRKPPLHLRLVRGVTWAGSFAMRPQLAMAALFMLVVGSSLLLLRTKPGSLNSPVQVTQRGEPGPASDELLKDEPGIRTLTEEVPQRPRAAAASPNNDKRHAGAAPADEEDHATSPSSKSDDNATPPATAMAMPPPLSPAESLPKSPEPNSALEGSAAQDLAVAEALRSSSGCGAALGALGKVAQNYPSTPEGMRAQKALADCSATAGKAPAKPATATATATPTASATAPKP